MMETPTRTLVKSLLWAALGLLTMGVVGVIFTGSLSVGGAMAVVNTLVGFSCYILYERLWARIRWGRRTSD